MIMTTKAGRWRGAAMNQGPRILLGGCLTVFLLAAGAWTRLAGASFDLRPQWDDTTPLRNPHKGWYHHCPDNHSNLNLATLAPSFFLESRSSQAGRLVTDAGTSQLFRYSSEWGPRGP